MQRFLEGNYLWLTSIIAYGCGIIEAGFSVTETQLLSWNTWIGSDCDTGLCQPRIQWHTRYLYWAGRLEPNEYDKLIIN